jgi:hypothetical protein
VLPNVFILTIHRSDTMIDPTIEALIASAEAGENGDTPPYRSSDPEADQSALAASKLCDALAAGFEPEFSPNEAETAGAFLEDALREEDARETGVDLPWFEPAVLAPQA